MRFRSNQRTLRASSFILLGLASLLACLNAAASEPGCWSSQVLSPIAPGNYWDFSSAGIPITISVEGEMELINGVPTNVMTTAGGTSAGDKSYALNNEQGLRLYGVYTPSLYVGNGFYLYDCYMLMDPPLLSLPMQTCLEDTILSEGYVDYFCDGEKVLETYYSSVRNIVSVEEVRVRFGTYDAVRIEETATVSIGDVEEVVTGTTWYLPGVGELKVITDSSEGRSTTRLTDTNLTPVPEPSTAACVATVLATLAVLHRRD